MASSIPGLPQGWSDFISQLADEYGVSVELIVAAASGVGAVCWVDDCTLEYENLEQGWGGRAVLDHPPRNGEEMIFKMAEITWTAAAAHAAGVRAVRRD